MFLEHIFVRFPGVQGPLGVDVGVLHNYPLVGSSSVVLHSFPFAGADECYGEGGTEGPVLDDVVVHTGKIKGGGVEVSHLRLAEEILYPHVYDVEDLGGEHMVVLEEVCVGGEVVFDMEEAMIRRVTTYTCVD